MRSPLFTLAAAAAAALASSTVTASPTGPKASGHILADRNATAPDLSPVKKWRIHAREKRGGARAAPQWLFLSEVVACARVVRLPAHRQPPPMLQCTLGLGWDAVEWRIYGVLDAAGVPGKDETRHRARIKKKKVPQPPSHPPFTAPFPSTTTTPAHQDHVDLLFRGHE